MIGMPRREVSLLTWRAQLAFVVEITILLSRVNLRSPISLLSVTFFPSSSPRIFGLFFGSPVPLVLDMNNTNF